MPACCSAHPVWRSPQLCKEHFLQAFERKTAATIKRHKLLTKKQKILVAVSGGKDSTALLYVLHTLGYSVTALAIDEGIHGYRDQTLRELQAFCKRERIPLTIVSFKQAYKKTLDAMLAERNYLPCSICGTFRRALLHKHAAGFDVLATGHNMDDEAQSVLMNLTRANTDLWPRGGPITTSKGAFIKRAKPFYWHTEKEILTYALLLGFATEFNECPYARQAYRGLIRDALNDFEAKHPGTKKNILERYLKTKKTAVTTVAVPCSSCGEPSQNGLCKACRLAAEIRSA